MSKVKNSFLDLVGNTPLVRVNNLIKKDELKADVFQSRRISQRQNCKRNDPRCTRKRIDQ
ncbi:MAG: hypothetical protein KH086_10015 [Coprobacillus sp.]|nr:hypothetical protein [Coprobacillus sp.]